MKKEKLERPEIEEIRFEENDVIATSPAPGQQEIGPVTADPGTETEIP